MILEIKSAADFLVDLLRLNNSGLTEKQLVKFQGNVCDILSRHYTDHWFPEKPFKGSGYRCLRINGNMDPLLARAGVMMGLAVSYLRGLFPSELTMWIDPMEVAYRIGENGSICVLYEEDKKLKSVSPSLSSSTESLSSLTKTPVKALPPPTLPTSPPAALPRHHHQFSSPSRIISHPQNQQQQSPPLSPVSSAQQAAQQATMQQISRFILSQESSKCKESLRTGLNSQAMQMERIFVSS